MREKEFEKMEKLKFHCTLQTIQENYMYMYVLS